MEVFPGDSEATHYSNLSSNFHLVPFSILRHSTELTVMLVLIYLLIFIIGVFGNGVLVVALYKKREIRTVSNTFIFNLAVADLLVVGMCVPVALPATIFTPWLLGPFLCKVMPYFQGVSICASAYSLVAISVDRCHGMYQPMRRGQLLSSGQADTCILFIWLISLIITVGDFVRVPPRRV